MSESTTGVAEGGEVSMFYDPMIAKLITTRRHARGAIDAQVEALDAFVIDGIGHNIDFLSALMQHPRFRAGELTTGFIAEEYPEGFAGAPADDELIADLALIAAACRPRDRRGAPARFQDQLSGPVPRARNADGAGSPAPSIAVTLGEAASSPCPDGERVERSIVGRWRPGRASAADGSIDGAQPDQSRSSAVAASGS